MTNKITRFGAWQNLERRYGLEARGVPAPKSFADTVIPVANADDALAISVTRTGTENLSGAVGTHIPYFTCPEGEEWLVWLIHRPVTVAASEIQAAVFQRDFTLGAFPVSIRNLAEVYERFDHLFVPTGGAIGMRTTGNGGDAAVTIQAWMRIFIVN